MKILFVGDIHIKQKNLTKIDQLEKAITSCQKDSLVLFAGDILHTHEQVNTQLMNRAIKLFQKCNNCHVLVGNHDYIDNSQFCSENHWMFPLKLQDKITIIDMPTKVQIGEGFIILVPYVPCGRFIEALNQIPDWKSALAIFGHQEMTGVKLGVIVSNAEEWLEDYPLLVSGHIHDRQRVSHNLFYPGSAVNHAFDYNSQSLWSFSYENDWTIEQIDIPMEQNIILRTIPKNIPEGNLKFVVDDTLENKLKLGAIQKNIKVKYNEKEKINIVKPFDDIFYKLVNQENDDLLKLDYNLVLKK